MNTVKSTLRARAAHLFAAEERTQELMGMALLQQHQGFSTLENAAGNSGADKSRLEALLTDSDQTIVNVHNQLQNARSYAAQLQADDAQLGELNRLIYGGGQNAAVEEVIEGEIIEEVRATKVD